MPIDDGYLEDMLAIKRDYLHEYADRTLMDKLPEWLTNFKINLDSIGFDRTIDDIPPIEGPAIVVDHPMTGSIEPLLPLLKHFKGTLLVCDRALYKVIPYRIPEYTANLDSSYLCMSFFDRPDVREVMKQITAIFSVTTFPLTIRHWHGNRVFFTPYLGGRNLTQGLSAISRTPSMHTGGNVGSFLWLLAQVLKANPIGLLGFDMCVEYMSQTEYPGVPHGRIAYDFAGRLLPQTVYVDPVYRKYAEILHSVIKYAKTHHKTETINLQPSQGIMHSEHIRDMLLEVFLDEYQ